MENVSKIIQLPCKVKDLIDTLISHNSQIALYYDAPGNDGHFMRIRQWHGMAWNIPTNLSEQEVEQLIDLVPDNITEADYINISVRRSE